jgi:diguanylate cyclase
MPIRYTESIEKSAEHLRQALALMSKQKAGLHPVSYAVWYEHVAGINRALSEQIDTLCADGKVLDEDQTWELYRRFIAAIDNETALQLSNDMQQVLATMSGSAAIAEGHASNFGNSLARWDAEIAISSAASIARIREDTNHMQEAVSTLKTQLDASQHEIDRLEQEITRAREDALCDGLTGLTNRKGFDLALTHHISDMGGNHQPPCLLMADIDYFKQVNDNYGHLFGDKVIQTVANILKASVKGADLAARFGGEEFVVLLPDTPLEGAQVLAEKIRSTIARSRIHRQGDHEALQTITISIGVTAYRTGEPVNVFINRADAALYSSKAEGRNRVTVA